MDYTMHVHLRPPDGRTRMTPLECEGAHRILREGLEWLLTDDLDVPSALPGLEISVEPYLTHIDLVMSAPSLAAAESACHSGIARVLERSRLLTDWRVDSCEVTLSPEMDFLTEDIEEPPPYERLFHDGHAMRLRNEAVKISAFGPEIFGDAEVETDAAALVCGALVQSAEMFIDMVCDDIAMLTRSGRGIVDVDTLYALSRLPAAYRHRYDLAFARSFLAAAVKVTDRFAGRDWTPPGSLAEALALHLIIDNTAAVLRGLDAVPVEEGRMLLSTLRFRLLSNLDHEALYTLPEGYTGDPVYAHLHVTLGVCGWFAPRDGSAVHPYRQDPAAYDDPEHEMDCLPGDDEVKEALSEKVGIDPERVSDVIDLLAICLTDAMWTHGPVMRWFAQRRLSDGELLRTTMHTIHHLRQILRGWRDELGLGPEATLSEMENLRPNPMTLAARLGNWLTDPERPLVTGQSYGALAAADHGECVDHAAQVLGSCLRHARAIGMARTFRVNAMQSGLGRYHWWGAPGWPEQVERILKLVRDPAHPAWGPDGRLTSGLPPRPAIDDAGALRAVLLEEPWALDAEAAEWCARASHLAHPEGDTGPI